MPIIPFFQHGGGQVPLQAHYASSLPVSSALPPYLPEYSSLSTQTFKHPRESTDAVSIVIIPTESSTPETTIHCTPTSLIANGDSSCGEDMAIIKGKKPVIAAVGTFFGLFSWSQIYQNTPGSWLNRTACDWFGRCGLAHLNETPRTSTPGAQKGINQDEEGKINLTDFWNDAQNIPDGWETQEEREIPRYVLDHAPLIHLFSGEQYWPCDMAEHLIHTTPHLNYTSLQATDDHPTIANLGKLNQWGRFVYLQSDDNVEDHPDWLGGETNIPTAPTYGYEKGKEEGKEKPSDFEEGRKDGKPNGRQVDFGDTRGRGGLQSVTTPSGHPVPTIAREGEELMTADERWQAELRNKKRRWAGKKVVGGRSDAPAVLIVVPKGNGVVDAFWMFFYSYNLGNAVFNVRFGNHVGDWEHTAVRFQHGKPKAVFFSEHSFGEAYTWDAVEKSGKRPIGFSATGTHAMYATPGLHPYVLPGGILHDVTDRGPLWDPVQNMYSYTYNYRSGTLLSSKLNPAAPVSWFYYGGHWGDKIYPLNDPRQYRFLGQYHYVNGPLGPRFKNLGRQEICQGRGACAVKKKIGDKSWSIKRWRDIGEGEELSEQEDRMVRGEAYEEATTPW